VDLGQDVHGGSFPLRREEDVGFVRVTEFKTKIDVARRWTCSRSASACPGSSSTSVLSEKLVTDNVVSRLKSNRTQGRVGPGDPRGGGGTPPSGRPTPRTLLRRPDPGRPSGYGKIASPGT